MPDCRSDKVVFYKFSNFRFKMLFRPTQKLASKIKVGKLIESALEQNPLADWSANLLVVNRRQQVLLCNTHTLFCCLMLAR
jgi:hypothetical protein